jgi:hypothetical protein
MEREQEKRDSRQERKQMMEMEQKMEINIRWRGSRRRNNRIEKREQKMK